MKILKEPLVHFVILSALFFAVYDYRNPSEPLELVKVSNTRIQQLKKVFYKTWGRAPTQKELKDIIKTHAVGEIYAREAKSYSLDLNDSIIRNRLKQKMNFLIEDLASMEKPTDEDLKKIYKELVDSNTKNYRLTFKQAYLDLDKSKETINKRITKSAQAIKLGKDPISDSSLLPNKLENITSHNIDRKFGKGFYTQIVDSEQGKWTGPYESGLGLHFVKIEKKNDDLNVSFESQKKFILNEWRIRKKNEFKKNYERDLFQKYQVILENNEKVNL